MITLFDIDTYSQEMELIYIYVLYSKRKFSSVRITHLRPNYDPLGKMQHQGLRS